MKRGNISSVRGGWSRFAAPSANLQKKARRSTAGEIGALSDGVGPPHRRQRHITTGLRVLSDAVVPNSWFPVSDGRQLGRGNAAPGVEILSAASDFVVSRVFQQR